MESIEVESEVAQIMKEDIIELFLLFVNLFDGVFINSDRLRVRSRNSLEELEPQLRLILNRLGSLTLTVPYFKPVGTLQCLLVV